MSKPLFAWTVHNLIGHPLMEVVFLLGLGSKRAERLSNWIHDVTMPKDNDDA